KFNELSCIEYNLNVVLFFFSRRGRHTTSKRDWSSDVCSSDLAHRLSQAKIADRILVMSDGAVVEQGTHDELVALGGDYARLWERSEERRVGKEGKCPRR